jgi:hypothetical protein
MFAKKSVVLMALLAGAFAADTIRNRLGQLNSKTLAQETKGGLQSGDDCWCDGDLAELPAVELPECPCNFQPLPGLGAGLNGGFENRAEVLQAELLRSVPDTQYSQICQSNCCSCEEEAHAGYTNQRKNRTFTISGSISVLETLRVQEQGRARENSEGYSEKNTICQTNNAEGGLGSGNECVEIKCPPADINLGGSGKKTGVAI